MTCDIDAKPQPPMMYENAKKELSLRSIHRRIPTRAILLQW
jgi:hypothetical protein